MNHTGVRSTGSRRHALRKRSFIGDADLLTKQFLVLASTFALKVRRLDQASATTVVVRLQVRAEAVVADRRPASCFQEVSCEGEQVFEPQRLEPHFRAEAAQLARDCIIEEVIAGDDGDRHF